MIDSLHLTYLLRQERERGGGELGETTEGGAYLGLPGLNVDSYFLQLCEAVLLSGVQNTLQISDAVAHSNSHLLSLSRRLGALVQRGPEPVDDLINTVLVH